MKDFISKEKMNTLSIICEAGHYKNRLFIVNNLNNISMPNQWVLIKVLLHDQIELISQEAISNSSKMKLNNSNRKIIIDKIEYWQKRKLEREEKEKTMKELLKDSTNTKRKFSKGESYQNMKEMLKKPMNTGKWF